MFNKISILLFAALSLLNACNNCDSAPEMPTLTSNSPITAGDSLIILARPKAYDIYRWTGPNGFTSTEPNIVITPATMSNAGEYTCYAESDDCTSESATINIVVNAPQPPCSPPENTANYPPGFPDVIYTNVHEATESGTGFYAISASGGFSELDILFSTTKRAVPGIYRIRSWDIHQSDLEPGDVRIPIIASGFVSCFFYARGGYLYVTERSGKLVATFCGVNFGYASSCDPITSLTACVVLD